MSSKLPEYCKNEIITSLANIDVIQKNIIEPITNSISEAIDSIILTMHKENFHMLVFVFFKYFNRIAK